MHPTESNDFYHQLKRVTIIVSLLFSGHIAAEPTQFRVEYQADIKGLPISATGIRTLEQVGDNRYLLSSSAENFLGAVREESLFSLEVDGDIKPLKYRYRRSGLGRNRDAILSFDWERNRVLNDVQSVPWEMDIPDGALDKLLYQFKVRRDLEKAYRQNQPWPELTYDIADGGKMKVYRFEVLGEDVTDTPMGQFRTIKVTRVQEDKDRTTLFWLAPAHEFLLVRLRLFEDDDGVELLIKEATFEGRSIKAAASR